MSLATRLKQLIRNDNRSEADYHTLIDELVTKSDLDGLVEVCAFLVEREAHDQFGRLYVTPGATVYLVEEILNDEKQEKAGLEVIELDDLIPFLSSIAKHLASADADICSNALYRCLWGLSACHRENEKDFKQAAFALQAMKFDDNVETDASVSYKVNWYVQAAEDWLEIAESGSAYEAIVDAKKHIRDVDRHDGGEGTKMYTRFNLCFARIQDHRRKFVDAAKRYFELTLSGVMNPSDLELTLRNAVTCCILGKAGPSRSRVLGLLHGDERTHSLVNFPMLHAMYKDQIIRPEETKVFSQLLVEHQSVMTTSGVSVLQQSVIQHNLLAVSRVYESISFVELGRVLGIAPEQTESMAATMIEQGVLEGTIDQVDGFIEFVCSGSASAEGTSNAQLKLWDSQISSICAQIQTSVTAMSG